LDYELCGIVYLIAVKWQVASKSSRVLDLGANFAKRSARCSRGKVHQCRLLRSEISMETFFC